MAFSRRPRTTLQIVSATQHQALIEETAMAHSSKSLAALLLVHIIGSAAPFITPSGIATTHRASRHASLLPPLRYLNSEDERDDRDNASFERPKKKRRSLIHRLDRLLTDFQMPSYHLQHHPYLSGNYAPVEKEHFQVDVEVVEGQIPKSIWGAFCRNGPNPKRERMEKRYHWFDGRKFLSIGFTKMIQF